MSPDLYRQVRELFEEALARPAGERAAFVENACRHNPQLCGEVQRLLAAEEKASEILQSPAAALKFAPADITGRRIGAYELLRQLGQGGMGTVYLARRADEAFRKEVALKLLRPGLSSADVLRRFQQERDILASLDHPHIARLLDGGSTPEGEPFFVMEYVQGAPIDVYCDEHCLDVSARLKLFQTVCAAVQYAHQNLVVHRDLKPSNILVTSDGTVKLLDFGIAKLLRLRENETELLTHSGSRAMTPEYASPEQIEGAPITTATDVYSLGVVLYELLTGRSPYRVSRPVMHEILRAICEQEPARPSTAVEQNPLASFQEGSAMRLQRRLRGDLDNIVLKALRKSPTQRYGSPEQFREDIDRHLAGLPVTAQKGTLRYRTRKFLRRNVAAVAAASVVILALAGGMAGISVEARRARAGEAEARRQADEAARQNFRAEGQEELAEAGRLEASKQRAIAEERSREAQARQAEAERRTREATAQREVAERRFNEVRQLAASLFDIHDAVEQLPGSIGPRNLIVSKALEYLDRLAKEATGNTDLAREVATGYERLADIQSGGTGTSKSSYARPNLGNPTAAAENYRKALNIREALISSEPNNRALRREWITLAQKVVTVKFITAAQDVPAERRKLIARLKSWAAVDPLDRQVEMALVTQAFGGCLGRLSSFAGPASDDELTDCRGAVDTLDQIAARHRFTFEGSLNRARTLNQLANKLISRKDYDAALERLKTAEHTLEEAVVQNPDRVAHDDLAIIVAGIAKAWTSKGYGPESVAAKLKTIEAVRTSIRYHRQLGTSNPLPSAVANLIPPLVDCCGDDKGQVLLSEFRAYVDAMDSLLKTTPAGPEKSDALVALQWGLNGLAGALVGRPGEAVEYAEKALRFAQELVSIDRSDGSALQHLFDAHISLGNARFNQQDYSGGQSAYRQALAIAGDLLRIDPNNFRIKGGAASAQFLLAQSIARTADLRSAIAEFGKATDLLERLVKENPSNGILSMNLADSLSSRADLHRRAASSAERVAERISELQQARSLYAQALERFDKSENSVRAYAPYARLSERIKESLRQCDLALAAMPR